MKSNSKYAVIGSGSWATAIVKILSDNLKSVTWYIRNEDNLNYILNNKHNPNWNKSNNSIKRAFSRRAHGKKFPNKK